MGTVRNKTWENTDSTSVTSLIQPAAEEGICQQMALSSSGGAEWASSAHCPCPIPAPALRRAPLVCVQGFGECGRCSPISTSVLSACSGCSFCPAGPAGAGALNPPLSSLPLSVASDQVELQAIETEMCASLTGFSLQSKEKAGLSLAKHFTF